MLGNEKIPAFIIWFGKCVETVTFDLRFDSDTAFKAFRKVVKNDSFFLMRGSSEFLEFYWGGAGDPFYTGQNDVDNMDYYAGAIAKTSFSKDVKGGFWRGTATFLLGEIISL